MHVREVEEHVADKVIIHVGVVDVLDDGRAVERLSVDDNEKEEDDEDEDEDEDDIDDEDEDDEDDEDDIDDDNI